MKIVHAFNRETRRYLGPLTLDASDQSPLEPGVWHIPGNCLEAAPPAAEPGTHVIADGVRWVLVCDPEPAAEEVAPPQAREERALDDRLAELVAGVQEFMEGAAVANGYDSLASAISYADEIAVPKFGAEGRAFRAWRSKVWAAYFDAAATWRLSADVPKLDDLLVSLPQLDLGAEDAWACAMQGSLDAMAAAGAAQSLATKA